jgi:hypothetical protein
MPSFDSPIGKKKFAGSPLRELDVPDESGYNAPSQQEPVVRRRQIPNVDTDAIRDFQAQMQRQEMPTYDRDPAEIEREIRQAKIDRKAGRERLNEGAKRRLEMLLGMTRSTRDVDILGNVFVLQTIPSKEMREAIMIASEYDGTVQSPFEIRRQFLARSLVRIAGIDVAQFVGSTDLDVRLAFIDELDESFLNRLYDEYLSLAKESEKKFAVKSAEEVKEIVEDLKK